MLKENILKKIKNGETNFFGILSDIEAEVIVQEIIESSLRLDYIEKCFLELKIKFPKYAFMLTYDLEEYKEFCLEYLNKDFSILLNRHSFFDFVGASKWGLEFVLEHLEALIMVEDDIIYWLINYSVFVGNKELVKKLIYSDNPNIRGLSLYELLYNYPYYFLSYCPDVMSTLVKYDTDGNIINMLDENIISKIAYLVLDQNIGYTLYNQLKEFIFSNYKYNLLGSLLAGEHTEFGDDPSPHIVELQSDMTRYFLTSKDYKYELYKIGEGYIDKDIYLDFKDRIEPFVGIDENIIEHIFRVGLGDRFLEFVTKYLEKSTSAIVEDLGRGSVTRVIRIGDYVIKCSEMKWDLVEEPPVMFLFAKDYEYESVRNELGVVSGALEVQKYYSKSVSKDEEMLIKQFFVELAKQNYVIKDEVRGMGDTPNLFHLDSYQDAQYSDEKMIPEWFKENPVVWVDIDMIHKLK